MTAAHALPYDASAPAAAGGGLTAVERQMAMFERLSEICMQVVEATGERVLAEAEAARSARDLAARVVEVEDAEAAAALPVAVSSNTPTTDPILAFTRATRAARLSLSLWRRACRENETQAAVAAREALEARRAEAASMQARAGRVVERVAHDHFEAALPGAERDAEAMARVREACTEARERLADEDLYGDLSAAPLSALVARVCADVGLSPDWPRLAEEHWALAEIAEAPGGSARDLVVAARLGALAAAGPNPASAPGRNHPPRLRSARWRRRHEPVDETAPPPQTLKVVFVDPNNPEPGMQYGKPPPRPDRPPHLNVDWR